MKFDRLLRTAEQAGLYVIARPGPYINAEVTSGGRRPLLLLLGTDATAATFWRAGTAADPVLVRGTALVRSADVRGDVVGLRADTAKAEADADAPVNPDPGHGDFPVPAGLVRPGEKAVCSETP